MPRRPLQGVVALAAALVSVAAAAAGAPATERSLASQVGRVTTKLEGGIHKGSLISRQVPGDPLGLMGAFQLDSSLWTLVGEPVEDYKLRWELGPELRFPGGEKTTVERLKRDEPDLFARLAALAPESVTVRAHVRFYEAAAAGAPFAEADLDLSPDLTASSGKPQGFSAPGSPEWGAWFSNVKPADAVCPAPEGESQAVAASEACVKQLWARAKRVEVTGASVVGVQWPEGDTRQLLGEIWARHHRAEQKARDRVASDAAFWATPSKPPLPLDAARDLPTRTVAATARPLDKPAREARKARFQKIDRAAFDVSVTGGETSCDGNATIFVDLHPDVQGHAAEVAPAVALDGKRLAGKLTSSGAALRHTFSFPFQPGSHALEIDVAGPQPFKRRERVSCITDEVATACLGSSQCPTTHICPCRIVR